MELFTFLIEAELQQYHAVLTNELKVTNCAHLKFVSDSDFLSIGFSRPEIRRLRKYYNKYFPRGYVRKLRKLFLRRPGLRDEVNSAFRESPRSSPTFQPSPRASISSASGSSGGVGGGGGASNKHIIPKDAITVNKQLGAGEFGVVQQGVWTNGTERIQVAIKCLSRENMQTNPMEFLKEAAIMHSIEHENIVRLYGVVLDTDALWLVTELAHLRSLLECLKDPNLKINFLTIPTLCDFIQQICGGMMYLEQKRLIHRDLAARNILVFNKDKVKISDFGLSRALGVGKNYYQTNFNINLKLPIAWCAPECINFLRFTSASDVWAFGVCMWEMFSYGFHPWAAMTGQQILEAIDDPIFQRLEQPDCCPRDYYLLMLKCWSHDPARRPKFGEIHKMLPEWRPEQLKTVAMNSDARNDQLLFRQNEVITVLDKISYAPMWKGALISGKTGLFNPNLTITESTKPQKAKLEAPPKEKSTMRRIFSPAQSAIYFEGSPKVYPKPIGPRKPSKDTDQTPLLLPPTPTSPDSQQRFEDFLDTLKQASAQYKPPDPPLAIFGHEETNPFAVKSPAADVAPKQPTKHEYHEISDSEGSISLSPTLSDVEAAFHGISLKGASATLPHHRGSPSKHFRRRLPLPLPTLPAIAKPKKATNVVKPISHKDEKLLDKAIEIAHKYSSRSMTDLGKENEQPSPTRKKFHFRFPSLTGHHAAGGGVGGDCPSIAEKREDAGPPTTGAAMVATSSNTLPMPPKKHFSEELKKVPSLQSTITEEAMEAYNSLVEHPTATLTRTDFIQETYDVKNFQERPDRRPKRSPERPRDLSISPEINNFLLDTPEGFDQSPSSVFDEYIFPERSLAKLAVDSTDSGNPLPLPPRDTKPKIQTNAKRHVRKYPLNFPTGSCPRTPDKTTASAIAHFHFPEPPKGTIASAKPRPPLPPPLLHPNYENIDRDADFASLNFESLIEAPAAPDETDGRGAGAVGEEEQEAKLKNSVSCEDLLAFANNVPKSQERGSESDEVRIISKVIGANFHAERAITILNLAEVDWDVHRAIKVYRLQDVLKAKRLTLPVLVDLLQTNDWDIHTVLVRHFNETDNLKVANT